MRLLVVEDDPMIGDSIRRGLKLADFAVDWVQDGTAAELALHNGVYDMMILDLGLPGKTGLQVLQEMRHQGNDLPVLIVTARDLVGDRVAGLNLGADDYLVKPFDLDELKARIHAVLRRHGGRSSSVIRYGPISLDPISHRVTLRGEPVALSSREFALLHALMSQPGAVLSLIQLEDALYGWNEEVASNAVEVHIHHLRRKLGSHAILNVRGVGYRVAKLDDLDP
jgi:two-component system, OmpR family, response regulator QseB